MLDKKRGIFKTYRNRAGKNSLSNNSVLAICEDKQGMLWIGTGEGLNSLDRKTGHFTVYKNNPEDSTSIGGNKIYSIYEDRENRLWIGTHSGGLNLMDRKTGKFRSYRGNNGYLTFDKRSIVQRIYEDNEGTFWICGFGNGLFSFDPATGKFKAYYDSKDKIHSVSSTAVMDILETGPGRYWVATYGGGIDRFDKATGIFEQIRENDSDPSSLSNNAVTGVIRDKQGTFWFATYGGGVCKYDKGNTRFKSYKKNDKSGAGLSSNVILNIFEDHTGNIWIGTWGGGMNKFNPQTGAFTPCKSMTDPSDENLINFISEDKNGMLWLGTTYGLKIYDPQKGLIKTYLHDAKDPNAISSNDISYIWIDKDNYIWCGTPLRGLEKFDPKTGHSFKYKNIPGDPQSLSQNNITFISENHEGKLLLGTWGGGLNIMDKKTGKFKVYKNIPEDTNTISNNTICAVYEDDKGLLYIGTANGLDIFNPATGKAKKYFQKDGLSGDVIYSIARDKKGFFWLGTNKGITKASFKNGVMSVKKFDIRDGLPSNEFNSTAICQTRDGHIYSGTNTGFTVFHPDSIKDNPYIPPVYITDFQVFNKSLSLDDPLHILKKLIAYTDTIVLSYKQNVFSFEFAALNYQIPEKNDYAYKMEGFDKDWNYTDASKRIATYTNLDPGEYTFRVKASNNDGIWNEKGVSLRIIITPPYWQTWWFRSIMILSLALILGGIVYYVSTSRLKKRLAEVQKQREIEAVRARISRDIHDDVGAGLSKIALMSEMGKINSAENAETNLRFGQLSKTASEMIDSLHEIIWAINPKHDTLRSFFGYVRSFTFDFFENTGINYTIDFPPEVEDIHLTPEFRRNIFMIVKETFNNIIRHSKAKNVHLDFSVSGNDFLFKIQDDGIGLGKQTESEFGNGLINMQQRAESLNCTFSINDAPIKGVLVTISGKLNETTTHANV